MNEQMFPGPGPSGQMTLKLKITDAKDLKCEKCGCRTFATVFYIKSWSKLQAASDQDVHKPFSAFACSECGHVNADQVMPSYEEFNAPPADTQQQGTEAGKTQS